MVCHHWLCAFDDYYNYGTVIVDEVIAIIMLFVTTTCPVLKIILISGRVIVISEEAIFIISLSSLFLFSLFSLSFSSFSSSKSFIYHLSGVSGL